MEKRPTLADIAARTDLSPAAVSMILSGKQKNRFPAGTKEKVWAEARSLGYLTPAERKTHPVVLVVCPSVINPYYATLLQGIEQAAQGKGWSTMTFTTYWSMERERTAMSMAQSPFFSGVVFAMAPQQPEMAVRLAKTVPLVIVSDKTGAMPVDTVEVNNREAGRMMGKYLLALGHKRICYASTTLNRQHSSRLLRLEGLREAYDGKGQVEVAVQEVEPARELGTVEIEHETGMALASRVLAEHPDVTAIVAINDMVAYGVMDGLAAAGKRIPEDYSVAGFDNIYPSRLHGVGLTTIDHFISQHGQSAFSLLRHKVSGEAPDSVTHMEFGNKLIIRRTTGVPRLS